MGEMTDDQLDMDDRVEASRGPDLAGLRAALEESIATLQSLADNGDYSAPSRDMKRWRAALETANPSPVPPGLDALRAMFKGISLPPGPDFAWVDGHRPFIDAALEVIDDWAATSDVEPRAEPWEKNAMDALPFPTTDASKWAAEFVRLHGGDEGLMLSWFANAIEHGRGPDLARRLDEAHAFGYREGHRRASDVEPSPDLSPLRALSERLDSALAAQLPARSVAEPVWQERNDWWVPADALRDAMNGLPCPMRSSLTGSPCTLAWGHDADSDTRFHRFAALHTGPSVPRDVEPSPDFDTAALTALVDNRQMPDTAKLTVTLGEFRAAIRAAQESPGVDWLRVAAQDVVGGWARLGYDMGVGIDRLRAALHTETSGEPR